MRNASFTNGRGLHRVAHEDSVEPRVARNLRRTTELRSSFLFSVTRVGLHTPHFKKTTRISFFLLLPHLIPHGLLHPLRRVHVRQLLHEVHDGRVLNTFLQQALLFLERDHKN